MHTEINIDLQDTEWELDYIDHDRNIKIYNLVG